MNGRRAKLIRRAVYGDMSSHHREYTEVINPHKPTTFIVRAGTMRELYQNAKRNWYRKGEMPTPWTPFTASTPSSSDSESQQGWGQASSEVLLDC